jgi:hypothetical protein
MTTEKVAKMPTANNRGQDDDSKQKWPQLTQQTKLAKMALAKNRG